VVAGTLLLSKHRRARRLALGFATAVTTASLGFPLMRATWTDTSAQASSLSQDRAKANAIAGEIQVEQTKIQQLGQQYDQELLAQQKTAGQITKTKSDIASAKADESSIEASLRKEAIAAYMDGGSLSTLQLLLESNTANVSVRQGFLDAATGEQRQQVASLQVTEQRLAKDERTLHTEQQAEAAQAKALAQDKAQAEALQRSEQQTLSSLKGRIAQLVAEQQAARKAAERAAEQRKIAQEQAQAQAQASGGRGGGGGGPASNAPLVIPQTGSLGARAVAIAEQQLGKPYVWAAAGPNSFDCSGLVQYVYAQLGISLAHYTVSQWDETAHVPLADAQPGNLVFYQDPGTGFIYHVGIYIGHGEMIDAPETGENVQIDTIYWPNLMSEVGVVQ
jgi:cell wall-associated NlpC family hydrolase